MIQVQGEVRLKKGKELSILRFHPWVFSGAIQSVTDNTTEGAWVKVVNYTGSTLGYGHFQNGSIAIRMLSFTDKKPTEQFWKDKLIAARAQRARIHLPSESTNAFRLVHGEGDGLPGLILDYYDGVVILQAHSAGMHNDRTNIASALADLFGNALKAVYYKSQGPLPSGSLRNSPDEYLFGSCNVPHKILEYNNTFEVDWEGGQKTGFFLDQRENREVLRRISNNKSVLNTFCYTGGFSIYTLQGGASLVHSVDSSLRAIEATRRNLTLNGFDPSIHECFGADTFDFLKDKKDVYDIIILDPPAFAKHRDARHQAIKGYQRLNTEAMRMIRSGGIIFTFSCSQVVDKKLFYDTIVSSGIQAGRKIKVLQHLSQPADHPVSIFHPEGEYLKGLVLYVE